MGAEDQQGRLAETLRKRIDFDPSQIAEALGSRAEKLSKETLKIIELEEGEEVFGIFLYNPNTHICCDLTIFPERRTVYVYKRASIEALQASAERNGETLIVTPHLDKPTGQVDVDLGFLGLDEITGIWAWSLANRVEFISEREGSITTLMVDSECRHAMTTYSRKER